MNYLKELGLSLVIILSTLGVINLVTENSKSMVKSQLDLCNLKVGEVGYIEGQVSSVYPTDWGKTLVEIGEGNGCKITVKSNPYKHLILQTIGNKVKILIKVETTEFVSIVNDRVSESLGVIGNGLPTGQITLKLSEDLLNRLSQMEYPKMLLGDKSFLISKEVLKDIQASQSFTWYYQISQANNNVVYRVARN